MMRTVLIFLLASGVLFSFFYFYPAEIFPAIIQSDLAEVTLDVSLKTLLFKEEFPDEVLAQNIVSVAPTTQAILLLLICLIGLPVMIALRFRQKRERSETN
jgi:hypothetical protein